MSRTSTPPRPRRRACVGAAALLAALAAGPLRAADWPTHRGNSERTGNVDGQPGPRKPSVLWVHKSREHHIAPPVPGDGVIYVSALSGLNAAALHALSDDPAAAQRVAWSKRPPFFTLPVVCPPAVVGGTLLFGDGMHQTSGATLRRVRASDGEPLWQLTVPGDLVHMEGSPAVADGRVFIGTGHGGVVCADLERVAFQGKEVAAGEAAKALDVLWAAMREQYEKDKKADPDFAVPPDRNQLPKVMPVVHWTQGKGKWHVDSGVAVAGGRVVAASAYLEAEKTGSRTLLALDAGDGATAWSRELPHNPVGGPSVAGGVVVVGCSSARFEVGQIAGAKGAVVAFDLATGAPKWSVAATGGVVASVPVAAGVAVAAATSGEVMALDLATGEVKWRRKVADAFFASPAVVGGVVYLADLTGTLHALSLADGKAIWSLDVARDPKVNARGMVYGSPVVHRGRIYLATCNIEKFPDGSAPGAESFIACVGD